MALEIPLWSAGPTGGEFQHSALLDRRLLDNLYGTEGVMSLTDLAVQPRSLGENMSVDVQPGACLIQGTSIANQGKYLCRSTAVENLAVSSAPPSGTRNDLVVARVKDSEVTGVTDGFFIEILDDTTVVPDDAIPLASLAVSSTTASIHSSHITNLRFSATYKPELLRAAKLENWTPTDPAHITTKEYSDTITYRRGGRVLIGYYNRSSSSSTNDNTIYVTIPEWAQSFNFFECILTANVTGADSDMSRATLRLNGTSYSSNDGQWRWVERWQASGGEGEGGAFNNETSGDFAVAARLGRTRGTARVLIERNLNSSGWSVLTDWGAHGSSGASLRTALGNAFSSWNQTQNLHTLWFVAGGLNVEFSSASRLAVFGVVRPGLDTSNPGAPLLDI